jgi:hypothetical protein
LKNKIKNWNEVTSRKMMSKVMRREKNSLEKKKNPTIVTTICTTKTKKN